MTTPTTDRPSLIGLTPSGDRSSAVVGIPRAVPQPPAPLRRPSNGRVSIPDDLHLTPPVVTGAGSPETAADWRAHLQAIFDYYAPQGRVEQIGVFRVASLFWRLDRAARCETDEIALSLASAELDAAHLLAAEDPLDPTDPVVRALPRDPAALRQRLEDAELAIKTLPVLLQATGPDPLPEAHATVALRFVADYTAPVTAATHSPAALPPLPVIGHWTGATLRTGLSHLFANRALGDVVTETIAYAKATVALAERRLAQIESLAARLRRQRVVPHSHVAARAQDHESHLATQLDLALRQLDELQAARVAPSTHATE